MKHPFQANNPKKESIIKLDKSSNQNKYIKPNGPLSKKDLRERKRERKSRKSHGKLRSELNYLASSSSNNNNHVKLSKRSRKQQHEFVGKLLTKVKGNILNIIKKLDSTRAIQTAIKYGSQPQILSITKELKGHFIDLCCDHYSHKTVKALLEYGRNEVREIIINELMKAITRLILHRLASSVVDYAIMVIADDKIRNKAFQFFISNKFIIMTQYEDDTETMPKSIDMILKESNDAERNQIIKNMEKFIISGFEKEIISAGVFQVILYHYVHNIWHNKRKMEEIIELMIPQIMQIQNVKEGVMSIIEIINYSMRVKPKLRKSIIKNMSEFIITMCCDKHSYLLVIRLLDIYDDTVLLNKNITKKLVQHLHILMYHDFGRLVLLHLLTPRNEKIFGKNKLYKLLCIKPLTQKEFEENKKNESKNTEKKVDDESAFLEDDDDEDEDDEDVDIGIIGNNISIDNDGNNFVDPSKEANCKKDYDYKRRQILEKLLPTMIDYCCDNVKKILCHDLAGTVIIELLRCLLYDENVKGNIKNLNVKTEKLIKCIINECIIDNEPREISPTPPEPEPPVVINDDVELTNIVDDSFNVIANKQKEKDKGNGNNMTLDNVDISKLDPLTAQNIAKLKQHEQMKKNNMEYMKLNAKYEIEYVNYQLCTIRHKKKIKEQDMKYGIMEHGLGHRRLRKMMEELPDIHKYFMETFQDKQIMDEDKWIYFLSVKGVYVIWELYNNGNDEVKQKLKEILTPICGKMKEFVKSDDENDEKAKRNDGLKKLCDALNVEL